MSVYRQTHPAVAGLWYGVVRVVEGGNDTTLFAEKTAFNSQSESQVSCDLHFKALLLKKQGLQKMFI